jgi:hypothetical protein
MERAFHLLGPELKCRWQGFRFLLSPWQRLLLIYVSIKPDDRLVIVTIRDARSASAATTVR